jgi:hypothetical protein
MASSSTPSSTTGKAGVIVAPDDANNMDKLVSRNYYFTSQSHGLSWLSARCTMSHVRMLRFTPPMPCIWSAPG